MKKLLSIVVLVCIVTSMCISSAYAFNSFEVVYGGGTVTCNTFDDAVNAVMANNGGVINAYENINLTRNVDLPAGSYIVASGNIQINLNDFTLSGTDNSSKNAGLINIYAGTTLTVSGPGRISYSATIDKGWGAYSAAISNERGTLYVNNGATVEHLGGTSMAYAIDNRTNGNGTKVYTTINSGNISSTYTAIRQFLNGGEAAENTVTVNSGNVTGTSRGIWLQDDSKDGDGKLTVASGAYVSKVHAFVKGDWDPDITVPANAVGAVTADGIPAGEILANVNGVYKTYDNIQAAFTEAGTNGSVGLVHAVNLTGNVNVPSGVTVNLNGNNVTGANLVVSNGGSMNVTDSVGGGSASVNGNTVTGGNKVTVGADGAASVAPIPSAPGSGGGAATVAPVVENMYYIPATDDNSNMALWSVLALALLSTAFVTRKRKTEN